MRHSRLAQSGHAVSELCLGAMAIGNRPSGFVRHGLDPAGSAALVGQACGRAIASQEASRGFGASPRGTPQ
jgi:aryl-alcohol dehydrogenase-like predicted oxidoreductase